MAFRALLLHATLLLACAATTTQAQSSLADRIISNVTLNVPEWTFDPQASQPRQTPLTASESRTGKTTTWRRTLVWTGRHDLPEQLVPQPAQITVQCIVHPTLEAAETSVRQLRQGISIATQSVPGVAYDVTYAGYDLGTGSLQLRRGRVVALIGAFRSLGLRLAAIMVSEIDRVPELFRDNPLEDPLSC